MKNVIKKSIFDQSDKMSSKRSISIRAYALALLKEDVHINRICERTGLLECAIYRVRQRVRRQDYDSNNNFVFKDKFFIEEP